MLDGTYQIQIINSRELPMFPMALLPKIDSLRAERDTVYIPFKTNQRIIVLPKVVINASGFKKTEHAIHIATE